MIHTHVSELIVGRSRVMQELRNEIQRAAPRQTTVLIQGPTGAGKELVAQGLHAESGRLGLFVPFNAAAIPEALFESELFGHVRGAFSGAVRDQPGLLRRAGHGTAFMDEVAELPLLAQAKLLRVLDTHEVSPVGGDVGKRTDFRLVAATNVDLTAAARHELFRTDLLFRLRGIVITVPALREHPEDIALLAAHFGRIAVAESGGADLAFTSSALRCLEEYPWPGNVRELRQTVEYAVFLSEGSVVDEVHIMRALSQPCASDVLLGPELEERRVLLKLLDEHAGDVAAIARALGIDRSTAYRRMHRLGITVASRGPRRRPIAVGDAIDLMRWES